MRRNYQEQIKTIRDELYNISSVNGFENYILDITSGIIQDYYHVLVGALEKLKDGAEANTEVDTLFNTMNDAILSTLAISQAGKAEELGQEEKEIIDYVKGLYKADFNDKDTYKQVYKKVLAEYFRLRDNDISETYTDLLSAAHDLDMAQSASLSIINKRYIKLLHVFDSMNRNIRAKTLQNHKYPNRMITITLIWVAYRPDSYNRVFYCTYVGQF